MEFPPATRTAPHSHPQGEKSKINVRNMPSRNKCFEQGILTQLRSAESRLSRALEETAEGRSAVPECLQWGHVEHRLRPPEGKPAPGSSSCLALWCTFHPCSPCPGGRHGEGSPSPGRFQREDNTCPVQRRWSLCSPLTMWPVPRLPAPPPLASAPNKHPGLQPL